MQTNLLSTKYKVVAVLSLVLFVVLTIIVKFHNQVLFSINVPPYEYISYSKLASYSGLWKTITFFGGPLFLGLMTLYAILYFWYKKDILDAFLYTFSMLGGFAIVGLVKYYTASERPLFIHAIEQTYSYPSGHTALSAIFLLLTGFVYVQDKQHKYQKAVLLCGAIFSVLIASSRLFLGEHWVSDVLGGYLLAFTWSFGCIYFIDIKNKPKATTPEENITIAH